MNLLLIDFFCTCPSSGWAVTCLTDNEEPFLGLQFVKHGKIANGVIVAEKWKHKEYLGKEHYAAPPKPPSLFPPLLLLPTYPSPNSTTVDW